MNQLNTTNSSILVTNPENWHILQNQPAFLDPFDQVYNVVLAQVVKSVNHLGWTIPKRNDLDVLINELTNSIQTYHKPLRTNEIALCFARGIRGEYGEYYGLNVITFEKFIMAYLASGYRLNLGKTLSAQIALPSPSRELTRQNRIDFASKAYELFKVSGHYDDLGNIIYTFLDAERLIPFTPAEKFEMLDQARQEEYGRLQNPVSVIEARHFNREIEALMTGNEKIIPKSRKIALNRYFKDLVTSGAESIPFQ